jgi:TetR/AcrR family transcriptional regulator, tetracycline repressor protein
MSTARSDTPGTRAPRRTAPLTRDEVLTAALDLAERDGVEALSMRKVAAAVGVEAMSLYNHVDGKDDVLDGLTGLFFTRIEIPAPTDDWRADVRALADAFRAAARRYPRVATLALTREAVSDAGVAATAAALAIFRRIGFAPDEAVQMLRTTMGFLIGTLLRELAFAPTFAAPADQVEARAAVLRASPYAVIAEAAEPLARLDFDREYRYGVDVMIGTLDARTP